MGWWKLELYSEGEYVVDTGNSDNNFFYNWSELTISPLDWFKVGMVTQRTRLYRTDRDHGSTVRRSTRELPLLVLVR